MSRGTPQAPSCWPGPPQQALVGCSQRWSLPSLGFIRHFCLNRHSRGLLANSTTGRFRLEPPHCWESCVANLNTALFCGGLELSGRWKGKTHVHAREQWPQSLTWLPGTCGDTKLSGAGRTGGRCSAPVPLTSAPPKDPGLPPECCVSCRDAQTAPDVPVWVLREGERSQASSAFLEILLALLHGDDASVPAVLA